MRRKLAAGNWKMNGTGAALAEIETLAKTFPDPGCDILICPPATLLSRMANAARGAVAVGGQDCHHMVSGAHTGDIAAHMLAEAGATYVITGHSERRADHGETNADIAAKTAAGWTADLSVIVCLGETLHEREAGATIEVVANQLAGSVPDGATAAKTVIAYEPVWAIGTGLVPTTEQIAEVHASIRTSLVARFGTSEGGAMRILYGGSVKPSNASEIFAVPDVDGALVGGASLKAADFSGIISALEASVG